MIDIIEARSPEQVDSVRSLLIEYQAGLGIDLSFQGFDEELVRLPGKYAPPTGRLLLACDTHELGCAALQRIDPTRAEMKRLYVRAEARGQGVGRALVERLLRDARSIGYSEIVLDTLPTMHEAQRLYDQLGFQDVEPYRPNPVIGTRYLSLKL